MSESFAFDPTTYRALMDEEIADYDGLQRHASAAFAQRPVRRLLDLGIGTGETTLRILASHPTATVVGVDENASMLDRARTQLPDSTHLVTQRLQDPLPEGGFDAVVSTLAIHHLDGPEKADLFTRVAAALRPGGRFTLADIVVPSDPRDVHTEIDGVFDTPSGRDEQLDWLSAAGLTPRVEWEYRDLVVIVADAAP
ncbi:class I SAM-dependent methyltransferase [Spiractinospora alimapuensis]|uniref:class I SAM-dependent methyltransferase n=1 Tax=Spiractinospora alimapuensis TaxID=2820884 RepID=UPI001F2B479E|nr:class I SAM-dependent methyltransferase [Spiractinospora alimapuensis]QVQ52617.1 class I SAM-dependent methyltransferase [Spiractinospora alimapuensis]